MQDLLTRPPAPCLPKTKAWRECVRMPCCLVVVYLTPSPRSTGGSHINSPRPGFKYPCSLPCALSRPYRVPGATTGCQRCLVWYTWRPAVARRQTSARQVPDQLSCADWRYGQETGTQSSILFHRYFKGRTAHSTGVCLHSHSHQEIYVHMNTILHNKFVPFRLHFLPCPWPEFQRDAAVRLSG